MSGAKEFADFIKYINDNKIVMNDNVKMCLKNLINLWKNVNQNCETDMFYLEHINTYDQITDFVRSKNMPEMLKLWFMHIIVLTSQNLNSREKKHIETNIAHYEFKIKIKEPYEELCDEEKCMLNFYRKLNVIGILSGNKNYIERSLIDKLITNCRLTPYDKINCDNIEIRKSEIHGHGLFAKGYIFANTIITFYPVDGYSCDDIDGNDIDDDDTDDYTDNITNTNNINYKVASDWIDNGQFMEDYSCTINEQLKIVANSNNKLNKKLLGHMINDSVGNVFLGNNKDEIKNGIYEYYMKSNNNSKLKINKKYGLIYIVTTKAIKKDEEITFSYGPLYWFSRFTQNKEDILKFYNVCNDKNISEFIKEQMQEQMQK